VNVFPLGSSAKPSPRLAAMFVDKLAPKQQLARTLKDQFLQSLVLFGEVVLKMFLNVYVFPIGSNAKSSPRLATMFVDKLALK